MIEFYPQIKCVHITAVTCSGVLFALRGAALLAGARWVMAAPLRYLSYVIDTALLAAAIALTLLLNQYPFLHAWLTVKVLLLVVYIVLGSFALKRGRTPLVRLACYLSAMAVYLFIASVAVWHDPRGLLAPVLSSQ